jgi:hypothetical protein
MLRFVLGLDLAILAVCILYWDWRDRPIDLTVDLNRPEARRARRLGTGPGPWSHPDAG